VIGYDKVSLPACTFGAGLAHAAALALVLPILITLPGPETGAPPRLVAIPVTIMPEPPAPAVAEPEDAIGELVARTSEEEPQPLQEFEPIAAEPAPPPQEEPATVEASDDVTGALPDDTLTEAVTPDAAPEVADVDVAPPPLPKRVQRDAGGDAVVPAKQPPKTVTSVKPAAPRPAPVYRRRAAKQDVAPYKGSWEALLGKPAFKPADKRGQ
jgi:hypothetical protein